MKKSDQSYVQPQSNSIPILRQQRTFAQHIVGGQGNDGAQRKDEGVHVLHVQIERGHRIGDLESR